MAIETKRIFLASSSELLEDRKEFELFINRRNKEWVKRDVFLELVLWEDFLDVMSKTRLQDEYNRAIRECDLFVMLFFTKVGRFTEEEFDTAFGQFKATNRPFIFTYFKDAPISTGGVDEDDLMSLLAFKKKLRALGHFLTPYKNVEGLQLHFGRQLDKLAAEGFIEFKPDEAATKGGDTYHAQLTGNGAIAEGDGAVAVGAGGVYVGGSIDMGTRIDTGGGHFIARASIRHITQVIQPGEDPEEVKAAIAHYLEVLAKDLAGLKLGEIDPTIDQTRRTPLQLADIYVPLNTTLRIHKEMALERWLLLTDGGEGKRDFTTSEREARPVSALEALAQHQELTLLGKPGGGKSTFGAHVLLILAQAWQGHEGELAKLGETWAQGALLPIRVILRRFAETLPPGDAPARAGDLWNFIAGDLNASGYGLPTRTVDYLKRLAINQGALILLDGLDECGDAAKRRRVLAAVKELTRNSGKHCRFLLTARPYAWPGGPDPHRGVYMLDDLDDEQIEQFIHGWYAALVKHQWRSPGDAEQKRDDLLAARGRPDLLALARNPLLLTLMATLHSNRGRLPDDRADLYNESVDLLLARWNQQVGADRALLDALEVPDLKLADLREALEELAFDTHERNLGREGAADIPEHRLVKAFLPLLNQSKDKADLVVDYIEKRAGLLLGQGEKDGERQFTFPHRTFQEFLAACHLANSDDLPGQCLRLANAAPSHWQEVLPLAARLAGSERGASAADELIGSRGIDLFCADKRPNPADWTRALLAGRQLMEIGPRSLNARERTQAIVRRVAGWLVAALPVHPDEGGLPAVRRAQAGDVLAALGDPRFDPRRYLLPADEMLGFVRILADPKFRIGTSKADRKRVAKASGEQVYDDELNEEITPTPEFHIARYPVTVAQFRAFVAATGYEIGDERALRDPDSRPVRYVSWREALAYCEWLNERLADSPELVSSPVAQLVREGGWRLTLPSELEWEKAARGGLADAVFPWGNNPDSERANYDDTGIGDTSAVGCFPVNYGLYDMAGNVLEWTRSRWEPYPYDRIEQREDLNAEGNRVVRGGAWSLPRGFVRCASRGWIRPDLRSYYLGFRVVLCSAPVRRL